MVTCGNFMVQAYIYSTKEVFHTGEGNFEKSTKGSLGNRQPGIGEYIRWSSGINPIQLS